MDVGIKSQASMLLGWKAKSGLSNDGLNRLRIHARSEITMI